MAILTEPGAPIRFKGERDGAKVFEGFDGGTFAFPGGPPSSGCPNVWMTKETWDANAADDAQDDADVADYWRDAFDRAPTATGPNGETLYLAFDINVVYLAD